MNMTSGMFTLNKADLVKGLATAVAGGVLLAVGTVVHGVISTTGFNVFAVDWTQVFQDTVNAAIIGGEAGFAGYIAKNFFSDSNGAVLGKFGGTK